MAGTTMYAFKAALLTTLQADATLSALQVTYGDPGGAQRREAVFLGDVESDDIEPEVIASGRRRMREQYTAEVFVAVQSKAAGLQEAEQRAVTLADAVHNVVADNPQMGGGVAGLMFCDVAGMSMSTSEAGIDGPRVVVTVRIRVLARLS